MRAPRPGPHTIPAIAMSAAANPTKVEMRNFADDRLIARWWPKPYRTPRDLRLSFQPRFTPLRVALHTAARAKSIGRMMCPSYRKAVVNATSVVLMPSAIGCADAAALQVSFG